jgi:molybdenum cofactor cytidylyltransferase
MTTANCRPPRVWAIVPAAGRSVRMGVNKLFLPFGASTVLGTLVATLQGGGLNGVFVVGRADDLALGRAVAEAGAEFVPAEVDPPDMRASIVYGLRRVAAERPDAADAWLTVPADHPLVAPATIHTLCDAWAERRRGIVMPAYHGKRGHPTLFAWDLAAAIATIPADSGLNWLVRQHAECLHVVEVPDPSILADLDRPSDYEHWKTRLDARPPENS